MSTCLRAGFLALIACAPAFAHAISMSSGYATVTGNRVEYILQMPMYEIGSLRNPEKQLLDQIRFSSGFERGKRLEEECHADAARTNYVCAANYVFAAPVETLSVDCTLYEVTVTNHIHVLRAERDGKTDRAILDAGFPSATLTFRPPTAFENAVDQIVSGGVRVFSSAAQILLLIAIACAARTRGEAAILGLAYLLALWAAALALPHSSWQPGSRFAEAGAAIALDYLAFEMLVFPLSRGRWMIALVFGAFTGLYFAAFLADSGYPAAYPLAGASLVSAAWLALLVFAVRLLDRFRARRWLAAALLLTGCIWFTLRLIR